MHFHKNKNNKETKQNKAKQSKTNDKKCNSFEVGEQKDTPGENSEMDKSSGSCPVWVLLLLFCFEYRFSREQRIDGCQFSNSSHLQFDLS